MDHRVREKKTLACVLDGLYNKKKALKVCSMRWVTACKPTKRQISSTLLEVLPNTSSYKGKMLGMLAIQLLFLAVEEYYRVMSDGNDVCCDSKGALYTFEKKSNQISSGEFNTEFQQMLRTINSRMKSNYVQHHVKAHQDRINIWKNLTYKEQLNSHCDSLTKSTIRSHLIDQAEFMVE